jgi:hypothetical protein
MYSTQNVNSLNQVLHVYTGPLILVIEFVFCVTEHLLLQILAFNECPPCMHSDHVL